MSQSKKNIKFAFGAMLTAGAIAAVASFAFALQPAKTANELAEPQVDIAAPSYQVENVVCHQYCTAKVKAGEYDIYIDYQLDDASVEFLEILNVVHFDKTVNAHVDRYEIEKINAAIAGGVK